MIIMGRLQYLAGSNAMKQVLVDFFEENPNPSGEEVEDLAGSLGVDKQELEIEIYRLLGELIGRNEKD
jgi:hypothetical protein